MDIRKYEDRDFLEIKDGLILWQGYFYDTGENDGWRWQDYNGFKTTVDEFMQKYNGDVYCEEFNIDSHERSYICDYTDDKIEDAIKETITGVKVINQKDINENTPDGYYVMEAKQL